MNNNSNKKYSLGLVPSILISAGITAIVTFFVFSNSNLQVVWEINSIRWMIIALLVLCFIGGVFVMNGAYYRLRDKIVLAMTGSNWVTKVVLLVLFMVLLGAISATFLTPLYRAAGS